MTYNKGIWRIDDGLEISRSIGDWKFKSKGVISIPEISHVELPETPWTLLLMSDGISDQINDQEICRINQEISLNCPLKNQTEKPDPPIALTGLAPEEGQSCDISRLGLDLSLFPETRLLGLKGCSDCVNGRTCANHLIPSQLLSRTEYGILENKIATTLVEEAHNRRSSDNLAVVLLNFKEVRVSYCFCMVS